MVAADRLRFDFSHPKPISAEEITRVEEIANSVVLADGDVVTRLMAVDEAVASGARALFGEKYGDEVRVVSMGQWGDGERSGSTFSVELCGGTHVRRTGEIGLVTVLGDSGVSAGVRRIEALTGLEARHYLNEQDRRVKSLAGLLRTQPNDILPRVETLMEDRRRLERELSEAKKKLAMGGSGGQPETVASIGGVQVMGRVVEGISPKDLKGLVDEAKKQIGSGIVVLVAVGEDGKGGIVAGVTPDLTQKFNAVDLVKVGSEAMGGRGGGGRPDMAQAGGPDGDKSADALDAVRARIAELAVA